MPHTRQTQVLAIQSQSLSPPTLHPHHPHKTHITPQSLTLSLSLTHSISPSQHSQNTYQQQSQYHSRERVREVSCAPQPADVSACNPKSVTPSLNPASTPHTQYSHRTAITLSLSLSLSLTISIHRHTTTNTHINNNHTISLTQKSERGQLCPTPGRRKCFKSRVSHSVCSMQIYSLQLMQAAFGAQDSKFFIIHRTFGSHEPSLSSQLQFAQLQLRLQLLPHQHTLLPVHPPQAAYLRSIGRAMPHLSHQGELHTPSLLCQATMFIPSTAKVLLFPRHKGQRSPHRTERVVHSHSTIITTQQRTFPIKHQRYNLCVAPCCPHCP